MKYLDDIKIGDVIVYRVSMGTITEGGSLSKSIKSGCYRFIYQIMDITYEPRLNYTGLKHLNFKIRGVSIESDLIDEGLFNTTCELSFEYTKEDKFFRSDFIIDCVFKDMIEARNEIIARAMYD